MTGSLLVEDMRVEVEAAVKYGGGGGGGEADAADAARTFEVRGCGS